MHSLLQLLAALSLATASTHATAFVSIFQPKTIGVHRSIYPSTNISLQCIDCNNRIKGYLRRCCRKSIDCRNNLSTTLSAIPSPQAVTTSISRFYKASPLLAGAIVGLISRLTQYSTRKDTKLSINNKHNNNSNFAMRALCSGLVLGILFEIMIHGSIILSILFGSTASIANGSINGMSIARSIM